MKNNTKTVIFGCIIVIGSGFLGYWMGQQSNNKEMEKIVSANTKQIQSLGVVAMTQKHNSDIIIQLLNTKEGRPVKDVPREIELVEQFILIRDDVDVPVNWDQIRKDQREVDMSIRSLASNNLFQAEALHNILDHLKE
tara:strand:- start:251 stop:664 length:414 start_codon:yes stop_codon:yes gene_type:complete